MRRHTKILIAVGIGTIAALAIIGPWRFSYFEICPICGRTENVSERQIPFTQFTYWRTSSIEETPLSKVVSDAGLVDPHQHTWLFGQGSGNGVTCALGPAHKLLAVVLSRHTSNFIRNVGVYQGKDQSRVWLRVALQAESLDDSMPLRAALIITHFPEQGFDSEHFDRWWQAHQQELAGYGLPSPLLHRIPPPQP